MKSRCILYDNSRTCLRSSSLPSVNASCLTYDRAYTEKEIGGDSTFRERSLGARAWSTQGRPDDTYHGTNNPHDGGGNTRVPRLQMVGANYGDNASSPGGIRASSRFVFPDGSVRRQLVEASSDGGGTKDEDRDASSVPMPLVGTSRIKSAGEFSLSPSSAFGLKALNPGDITRDRRAGIDEQARGSDGISSEGKAAYEPGRGGGAYRGPGAKSDASFPPGGRLPRPYVPFLNLPKSGGARGVVYRGWNGGGSGGSQQHDRGRGAAVASDGVDMNSGLDDRQTRGGGRDRPLAGMSGVLVSAGRAMLTGPGRPGTARTSPSSRLSSSRSSSRTYFGGHGIGSDCGRGTPSCRSVRRQVRQRRRGGGSDFMSDGADSVRSGSTDVEFLRRRAEAKLRALERREAASEERAGTTMLHTSRVPR